MEFTLKLASFLVFLFTITPHPKNSFNCNSKFISLEFRDIWKLGFTAQTNLSLILLSI